MYNFNKKQKIIIGIISAILIVAICYYAYSKEDNFNDTQTDLDNNIEEIKEEQKEDNESDFILVHVSGAINKEDVYELKPNSRISDAIEKAGGLREDAYINDINLAYKLEDGMKIHIPTIQEKDEINNENENENKIEIKNKNDNEEKETSNNYITTSSGINNLNGNNENEETKKVNINTATQTELETLPGIGPSTALKIITHRKENGKFNKIEDIKEVSGIGDAKFEKIKEFISI